MVSVFSHPMFALLLPPPSPELLPYYAWLSSRKAVAKRKQDLIHNIAGVASLVNAVEATAESSPPAAGAAAGAFNCGRTLQQSGSCPTTGWSASTTSAASLSAFCAEAIDGTVASEPARALAPRGHAAGRGANGRVCLGSVALAACAPCASCAAMPARLLQSVSSGPVTEASFVTRCAAVEERCLPSTA